ncbi:MAG: ornithine cyclodeaminase family protein [Egibacteraceae bacterium]
MLLLSRQQVAALLDLDALVDAVARAMADLSAGRASVPSRIAAAVDQPQSFLAAMPAYLPSQRSLAAKLVTLFPGNAAAGIDTHQAMIAVFDAATGTPAAVMDGTYITATRTAAGSALATRLLARPDASVLAIIGTGVQARAHGHAVPRVCALEQVRVAGRDPAKASKLALELEAELDLPVQVAGSVRQALDGADIVCLTTHSPEPVAQRAWLGEGAHVNSVGCNFAGREVDGRTVADSLLVVESRDSAFAPPPTGSNDLGWPLRDGLITRDHVHAEIGELVAQTRPGRTDRDQLTLYKSVGVAAQDAAAAALVLAEAERRGVGVRVDLD